MVDFSLFSVLECPDGRSPEDVYREMLALFAYSEELGFRGAWVAEHHFSDYGTLADPPSSSPRWPPEPAGCASARPFPSCRSTTRSGWPRTMPSST